MNVKDRGGGAVGSSVASEATVPWFESHRFQIFRLWSFNGIERRKKERDFRNGPSKKKNRMLKRTTLRKTFGHADSCDTRHPIRLRWLPFRKSIRLLCYSNEIRFPMGNGHEMLKSSVIEIRTAGMHNVAFSLS